MFNRFKAWLIHEDENMPTELKLGRLDYLDGLDTRTCCGKEMVA